MPNKRNPDVPELVRAKSSIVMGGLTSAQLLIKGLPSSYNSDLHELKRIYQNSFHQLYISLQTLSPFINQLSANEKSARRLLQLGHILATDVANDLVHVQKIPFRESYDLIKEKVFKGEEVTELSPQISFESAVEQRNNFGGTSYQRTLESIHFLKSKIKIESFKLLNKFGK
jgi:argininosuccinate lyase